MSGHALEPELAAPLVPLAPPPRRSLTGLALALGVVAATAFAAAWGSTQLYYVLTDAWVAPLQVLQVLHNRGVAAELRDQQLAQLARLDAEVARIADQLAALDGVIATLAALERADAGGPCLPRATAAPTGVLEDVTAVDDHADRLELELERLRSEVAVDRARRSAASTSAPRAVLAERETQPRFRATRGATEIAFVASDQLPGVRAGAHVMACAWRLFDCREVGRVTEVIPGEVAMHDPDGALVHGQYVVLVLDDQDASYERVLRVRS